MKRLHITNGDAAVELLQVAGITGDYLPWRDVLHMGPVPSALPLVQLSAVRAAFIADVFDIDADTIAQDFQQRDNTLNGLDDYAEVILWFEHDLYDQLQLIQVLDSCAAHIDKLWLINPGKHLNYHTPDEVPSLWDQRVRVSDTQINLAKRAWQAFGQASPESWAALLQVDTSALPFLHNAILRGLQELPGRRSGVNQTEWQILQLLQNGPLDRRQLFRQYTQGEQDAFHGDSGFFWYLDQLIEDTPAICEMHNDQVTLTDTGKQLLAVELFWQRRYNQPQWLGGYCLSDPTQARFLWDQQAQQLTPYDANL